MMAGVETTRYKCRHRPCEGTILKMQEGVYACSDCGQFWYPPKPRGPITRKVRSLEVAEYIARLQRENEWLRERLAAVEQQLGDLLRGGQKQQESP